MYDMLSNMALLPAKAPKKENKHDYQRQPQNRHPFLLL